MHCTVGASSVKSNTPASVFACINRCSTPSMGRARNATSPRSTGASNGCVHRVTSRLLALTSAAITVKYLPISWPISSGVRYQCLTSRSGTVRWISS